MGGAAESHAGRSLRYNLPSEREREGGEEKNRLGRSLFVSAWEEKPRDVATGEDLNVGVHHQRKWNYAFFGGGEFSRVASPFPAAGGDDPLAFRRRYLQRKRADRHHGAAAVARRCAMNEMGFFEGEMRLERSAVPRVRVARWINQPRRGGMLRPSARRRISTRIAKKQHISVVS